MLEQMKEWKRTHYCGELSLKEAGKTVTVTGWVKSKRDHGGVTFVDLRDRTGIIQIVFNPQTDANLHSLAQTLKDEWVIAIRGKIAERSPETVNPNIKTGRIELIAQDMKILNTCALLPFPLEDDIHVDELLRMKYRFLDLRRPKMQENIIFRHKVTAATRSYLNSKGFIEIETPYLTKSTPEGARDFLVPSRLNPGNFYALPQSPQLLKQTLMVAGYDKYYQIAKCFRDEDFRADRQPEFTQIDLEMSFVSEEDVMEITEGILSAIFKETMGIELEVPFTRISYEEALKRYGTDRPDIRFGLELVDITEVFKQTGFKVFKAAVDTGGIIKALNLKGKGNNLSRKDIDNLTEKAKSLGAKGLAWIRVEGNDWQSPITKFFTDEEKEAIRSRLNIEDGDIIFFGADKKDIVNAVLSNLRLELGKQFQFINENEYRFLWIVDFPLVEFNEQENRYEALHHPFTSPREEDIEFLETNPEKVRSRAYDIVLNGIEIGGGSIRIHKKDIQKRVFNLIGLNEQEAQDKFGFLMNALDFGAPPHGGIALGLDRITMILRKENSIRDVIAFPKTQKGVCPFTGAPSAIPNDKLFELGIKLDSKLLKKHTKN